MKNKSLNKMIIAIDKIFVLFKYIISTKLVLFSFQKIIHPKDISYSKCCLFEVKIILYLIQFIIISILYQIKSNINFDLFHYQVSKITLKIKGIGDSYILGNETNYTFTGFKNLKEVYINGLKQNTIDYLYYFNQSDNLVELIWDDDINSCEFMFRKCSNITEINLSNFNTSHVTAMNNMFAFCSSLISLDLSNIDTNHVTRIFAMFYGCISLTSLNLSNFDTSKVKNMQNMFYNCSSLTSLDLSNFKTTIVKNMQYMFYNCSSLTSLNLSNFDTSQVTNIHDMFNGCEKLEYINLNNFNESKLSEDSDGYYYQNIFKNLPENIVICINENITQSKIFPQIKNITCHVIDCTENWKSKQKKCIKYNNISIIEDLIIKEKNKTDQMSLDEEIEYYDYLLKTIENIFTENYDTSKIDDGQDEVITTGKMTLTLTTSQNQRNNINNNMTSIDLGECETLLKNEYHISSNETIYIKKIDIEKKGIKIPKVEYDVYCKLFETNLTKLNLTVCEKSKIFIYIPFLLTDDIDKYDINSEYYKDICYSTTSEDGTDISIKDRQKDFIDKDRIVCQEDCDFSAYDRVNNKAKCSCKVKESSKSFAYMNIDIQKLVKNFINIKNIVNYKFLVCYKKLFNKENLINNIGCYIILVIILFHIISFFIFNLKSFPSIKRRIDFKFLKESDNKKSNKKEGSKKDKFKINGIKIFKKFKKINNAKSFAAKKKIMNESKIKIFSKNKKKVVRKEISKNYNDEEINGFSYNIAIQYDKRTYCQYYASLLKTQHNLICAFFNNNHYNSGIIKLDLFFIGFAIEYAINGLFYNDETMHKIYESRGEFDIIYQLPIIIYSTIISMILNSPLNLLALSNNVKIDSKQSITKYKIIKKAKNLKNILTIKFCLYFIISFFYLSFFWYYISLFGVIYKNTQNTFIKRYINEYRIIIAYSFWNLFITWIF